MKEAAHQEIQATRVPIPMGDGVPELENASGKQVQEDHEGETHIGPPKPYPDELLGSLPDGVGLHGPQAKDENRQGQHPEDAKQGGVSVVGGERGADLEVGHDGQVDEEAENPCADKVPHSDRHQEIDGPLLRGGEFAAAHGALLVLQLDEVPGVQG